MVNTVMGDVLSPSSLLTECSMVTRYVAVKSEANQFIRYQLTLLLINVDVISMGSRNGLNSSQLICVCLVGGSRFLQSRLLHF